MDPFRNYRQVVQGAEQRCPFGGCAVCCSQRDFVRREFSDLVGRSWSAAERDILTRAARSALL
jgi:hypothetical protein